MQGLKHMLLQEQKHLEDIVYKAKTGLSAAPEGHLRISKDKNKIRYYHCKGDSNGIYIPKSDKKLPQKLAQKTYNLSVIKKAESRLKQIKKITKDYSDDEIESLFTSLHTNRQGLVTPVEPTWKQLLDAWYAEEYQGKEFQEGTAVILTEKGERVRSKSEKILADFFYRRNIPYKYEKPLYLRGYGTVYPDFSFLSKKTGQEIYWEHEGMMDKQEYARTAIRKIESYQKNDIYPGDRLILTFETEQSVLNTKMIEGLVNKYLKFSMH
ncbi:hypothetical protein [Ruminococcus sp. 2227st1_E6_2227SCRN_220401]|uniref:hypothetical protein n=1 Tax=unclassified Ruminococcus TaxID=2608920 RepID=UPI00319DB9B1